MKKWVGKWFIQLWSSKNKIIEVGIGSNYADGNYGAFFAKAYTFWFFYCYVARPTLKYKIQRNEA